MVAHRRDMPRARYKRKPSKGRVDDAIWRCPVSTNKYKLSLCFPATGEGKGARVCEQSLVNLGSVSQTWIGELQP